MVLKQEKFLLLGLLAAIIAYVTEHTILASGQLTSLIATAVLVGVIVMVSMRVAHHAEVLAERVGEPYGTMILTLSAVLIEVVILLIMLQHKVSPTLVRDTIYSAVMLDINGILGLAAILGGLKYGEQKYNIDSGNTYIVMIMTAMGVSMVIPEFIPMGHWQIYSAFTVGIMLLLYAVFLRMQTGKHSYFFSYTYAAQHHEGATHHQAPIWHSVALLVVGVTLIGVLAEVMSKTMDVGLAGTGMPPMIAGLVVATISASPEILTALRAALANRMQPAVNIALGASLSTVILTVPVIECYALLSGTPIHMALTPTQTAMALLTLLVAGINLHDGESNAIEGMTHFALFATFLMLTALGM